MPRLSPTAIKLALTIEDLATPLKVTAFEGREEISRPFQFDIQARAGTLSVAPGALLDRGAQLRLRGPDGERVVQGIVGHIEAGPAQGGETPLFVSLVPALWRLAQRQTFRAFQDLSVPEVVEQVLAGAGLDGFQFDLMGDYPVEDTLVQYDETDFDFVSRLLEEAGIAYAFDPESGEIRFGDGASGPVPPAGGGNLTAKYKAGGGARDAVVTAFRAGDGLRPGRIALRAYDFRTPAAYLDAIASGNSFQEREVFDYPGGYGDAATGQARATARLEGFAAEARQSFSEGTVLRLLPGAPFKLADAGAPLDGDHLVTEVTHSFSGDGEEAGYANRFTCLPAGTQFRPAQVTADPRLPGAESAIVVGPAGEEIHCDEFGRVLLRFHWDRASGGATSFWVRVAQPWAGANHGTLFLPRVGSEVLVQFLGGDPREPVVVGGLYNGAAMPPVALPADKSRSGLVTQSTPGGRIGHALLFEDASGSEQVMLHAERRLAITASGDAAVEVARDTTLDSARNHVVTVGANETLTVGANRGVTVGGALTESIAGAKTESIGAGCNESVGGALSLTVGGAYTLAVGALQAEQVSGARTENVGSNKTVTIGRDLTEQVGRDADIAVGKTYRVKANRVDIEADQQITLLTGKASLVMKANGDIALNGTAITIKASGEVVIKGSKVTTT